MAFGSIPKDGGTFTFYRNQRPALLEEGMDLRCVTVGRREAGLVESAYRDDGCVVLAETSRDIKKQAMAFAEWCEREEVDIVMGINSEAILSALPHLPERIRCMARCANAFDHGYRITMSCRDRLARVVATTPRLQHDLVNDYGADPGTMVLIPNGIAPEIFDGAAAAPRGGNAEIRLGFLGRLEHTQKGVLHLPGIVQELKRLGVSFKLSIAGKGKHRPILEEQMATEIAGGEVEFLGALPPGDVPGFLGATDVFVFTSHFEGCPNALLEAMMAGCVPVSWVIEGITDYLIEDGRTGFLCDLADCVGAAGRIARLGNERESLATMSKAVAAEARERFTNRRAASSYAGLCKEVMAEPPPPWEPLPWGRFQREPNFEHSWKDWVPARIKAFLKRRRGEVS